MTPFVQALCVEVWQDRAAGTLVRDAMSLACRLYETVARDVAWARERRVLWDPEEDRRVEWLRAVLVGVRRYRPQVEPRADEALEDLMGWVLFEKARELCGKELAAGAAADG